MRQIHAEVYSGRRYCSGGRSWLETDRLRAALRERINSHLTSRAHRDLLTDGRLRPTGAS